MKNQVSHIQHIKCWWTKSHNLLLEVIDTAAVQYLIKGFPDSSLGKESACNTGDPRLIPGLGGSAGEGIGLPPQDSWASFVAQVVKNLPAMWETWVWSLGLEDPLENLKITVDGDCNHKIKRRLFLGRKAMTNLDSILKSRDISLPTEVHIVKTVVFPVVTYWCESWTTDKAECQRMDAFELWCWTLENPFARKSNQSILKEVDPE